MALLELDNVTKRFGGLVAVNQVSLKIDKGEFVGIVGPNAAELIAEGALAIQTEAILTDLAATLHPHPAHGEFICEPGHGSNASRAAGGD